jgi:hypothetical protein
MFAFNEIRGITIIQSCRHGSVFAYSGIEKLDTPAVEALLKMPTLAH